MTIHLTIEFDTEKSRLKILAVDLESGKSKQVTRSNNSIDRINYMSDIYRILVAQRSFLDENDSGLLSLAKKLGEEIYKLFFQGFENFLEPGSTILIQQNLFLLPLELAFDGEQFLALRYSIGNLIPQKNRLASNKRLLSTKTSKAFFVGDKNRSELECFRLLSKSMTCEALEERSVDYLLDKINDEQVSFLLHFSCHGRVDESKPDNSYLILNLEQSGNPKQAKEFYILSLDQLQRKLNVNGSLVFLNTCQSGKLDKNNYQGFIKFAEGFLRSGAENCITTLWSVSDQNASKFAMNFYTNLLEGKPIGEALRSARNLSWIEKDSILIGLSYILFGDPREIIKISEEG